MFKQYQINEEEKVENSERIIQDKTKTYLIKNKNRSFKEKDITSNILIKNQTLTGTSSSTKNMRGIREKYKKELGTINSRNFVNQQIDENKTMVDKSKGNKYPEEILLNKNELYNAFISFQELMNKDEYKNKNEDYIKNKLFEYIIHNKNEEYKIEYYNNYKENKYGLNTHDYVHFNSKTLYDFNSRQLKNKNLIKPFSFSYSNNFNKNNLLNLSNENIRDTQKSFSQMFDELLLTNEKFRNKTISDDNSKYLNHEYSYDLRHKEKNNISYNSIPDKEKDDKFFDLNNNFFIDNYNSDKKELQHKNYYENKSEKILIKNNFGKINFTDDLLMEPNYKKTENINTIEYKLEKEKEENDDFNKYLNDKDLLRKTIKISPSKNPNEELYLENKNFKPKNKESFIEPERNVINEIKVNKSRVLSNKEMLINEKLKELDEEIRQFHEERKKMESIKDEYEDLKSKLLKEMEEFNLKKQIQQKYFGGDYDRLKNTPKTETKVIMAITQHNRNLLLNNDKKTETIKLLRKRIYQLENIIKNRNKNIQDSKKIHESIIKSIKENNINIIAKKRNDMKKKSNDDYSLKNRKINLKKNIVTCSLEKIKENNKNDNLYQNTNKNRNINNNLNKLYFENKNNNKKSSNVSYRERKGFKNNIMTTKTLNFNYIFNNGKKSLESNTQGYNLTTFENINKKYNNTIKGNKNNKKNSKGNAKIETSNVEIYEKLIRNEKERERINKYNRIRLNINSVRDFGEHKKIMKKLKTEFHKDNEKVKEKYRRIIINNNHFNEIKNSSKNYQKSQGKNPLSKRLELKIDIHKNKSNSNFLITNKFINKKNKIKNISSQARNTINYENNSPKDNAKKNRKDNNSLDDKFINNKIDCNDLELNDNDNISGYDFIIPEQYKIIDNGKIINSINSDGKKINIYENNKKEIIFQSGVRKEIFPDGYQLIHFPNGDMKQKYIGKEEKIIYFYNETNTVQTTLKTGINIFKFNNGQIEKHYPDGSKYIFYTNGLRKKISKNGTEENFFPEDQQKFKEDISKNQVVDII